MGHGRYADVKAYWEHFSHDADIGLLGVGNSPAEAFEQAGLALCAVVTDPDRVRPLESIGIALDAPDIELLFMDWINRLIYEMAVRNMLFSKFSVGTDGARLDALAWGEKTDKCRHEPVVEVKGATFTELKVREMEDGSWQAQCVVDV